MASVEEHLYLESDGSCANCGIRDPRFLTVHHLEQSEPKNEAYDNKLLLCHNCHQAHHQAKGLSAEDLRTIKHRLIVKTLTRPGLNALKEAYRRSLVVAMPFLINHLVELGYLQLRREGVSWSDGDKSGIVEAEYTITCSGRALLEKWLLK